MRTPRRPTWSSAGTARPTAHAAAPTTTPGSTRPSGPDRSFSRPRRDTRGRGVRAVTERARGPRHTLAMPSRQSRFIMAVQLWGDAFAGWACGLDGEEIDAAFGPHAELSELTARVADKLVEIG